MDNEKLLKELSELRVQLALIKGEVLEKVRAEYVSKETYSVTSRSVDKVIDTVKRLEKQMYVAIVLAGLVLLLGRIFSKHIGL